MRSVRFQSLFQIQSQSQFLACIVIGIEQYMMYCDWDPVKYLIDIDDDDDVDDDNQR